MRKYEITDIAHPDTPSLHRIRAVVNIPKYGIKAGDLGGYIEKESNLSHEGDCWVYDNAQVCGYAVVYGNAKVCGYAVVYDNAQVWGDAVVYGNAEVHGNAEVWGNAEVCGYAWCIVTGKQIGRAHV